MANVLARIAGAFEHPERTIPDKSLSQVYLEILAGVLADSGGLTIDQVDGLFTSNTPGGIVSLAEILGLRNLRHLNGTDIGGATYVSSLGAASRAIAAGQCSVALVIMAGLPRQGGSNAPAPSMLTEFERAHGSTLIGQYALAARRHMAEFGTTREDLAHIKVAASYHASFNPNAFLPKRVTVQDVLDAPPIAEPLHRNDCCVTTDGGGAMLLVSEEIARELGRPLPGVLAQAETTRNWANGGFDLVNTGAQFTGPQALADAGLTHADIDYASIYDSFTITVLLTLEDLGFCEKGRGAMFVRDGALIGPDGRLPMNTDGGGLSNNHPDRRGGMIRSIEAIRQLRGDANPALQVADCEFALVHGTGHSLGSRYSSSTAILCRGDVR